MTLGLFLAVATAGCVAAPPDADPLVATPLREVRDPPGERPLRVATVRVRNVGCASLGTGSGVVVDEGLIATNRHVVDGASRLEINTWDGQTFEVDVASAASESDLALVRVAGTLPPAIPVADRDLEAGETVTIAGYPAGRRFTTVTGEVRAIGPIPGDEIGDVARVDARVRPGNSGGPVGDEAGRLVGLVYAATTDDGDALVIPASRLRALRDAGSFAPVAPCDVARRSPVEVATEAGVGQSTLPPAPSTTAPPSCPSGRPGVALTGLEASERPGGKPAWDIRLGYALTNGTTAAITVRQVEITITYSDGTTSTHTFEGAELAPGQETTQEQEVTAGRPEASPQSAGSAMTWRWTDDSLGRQCPAPE
jgi:hypothetical protein